MVSGSNTDMLSIPNEGHQVPAGNFEDNLRTELELLLRENSNHSVAGRGGDLNIYRSGSAPPTVEGSINAVGSLFTSSYYNEFNTKSGSNDGVLSEDEIRSHPDYLSYYYSNDHINPRLPPPLVSKEDWRVAQRFQGIGSSLGRQGDWNWKKLVDGNTSSSLFSMQPGSSVQRTDKNNGNVMEFGDANGKNLPRKTLSEWHDRGREGFVGSGGNGLGARRKSFADIVQEGLGESASMSGQLSRPASHNSFGDVDNMGMNDIKPPGLCNGVGPIEDMHTPGPPGFVGVQSHNKAASHSFLNPNCSTLSRSTTPEPQLVGRSLSFGLPPVGSRVFAVEKKNITSSKVQNGYSAGFTELPDISGLHLSSIRHEDGVNGAQSRLQLDLGEQSDFLINMPNGILPRTLPDLSDKKLSKPSDNIDLTRKSGIVMNPRASTMSSHDHVNFPKRTSSSTNLYSKPNSSGFVSKDGPTRHLQNANLQSVDLAGYPSGDFSMNMNHSSAMNSYGTSDHIKLPSGTSDRPNHAGSSLQPHNYYGISQGDLQGLRSAYLEALLAQQKQHYELSLSGNSSVYNHRLYTNTPYGSGIPYLADQALDSGLSSVGHGGTMLQNERILRFNSMMRTSIGAHGSWQPEIGNTADRSFPSTLLDEFKSNKTRSFELSDIVDHVIEFSMDQYGSRFIQQKLETANVEEKTKIFPEIIPHARTLMTDVFGNYVIQKFFEHGTASQRKELAEQLSGHVLPLSLQMYGCRVIQKALEVVDSEQQTQMVAELDGSIMKCVRDQNGNHVIQKCIECIPQERIQFIISAFYGQVLALSTHPYGCRVIQRVLEHCDDSNTQQIIMDEIMQSVCLLAQDQYGNYVIQHVLEFGKPHERSVIISKLAGQIVKMSQQKFASNVVEKCLTFGSPEERQLLVNEILGSTDENEPLQAMMKDPFGNYVVQKVLESCDDHSLELILSRIRVHLNSLKRYTYGKHIVSRVEKLITTGGKPFFPILITLDFFHSNQGKQLANQLRTHLHPSSSSHGILLIDKILRSYENALLALSGGAAASVNSAIAPVNAAVQDGDVSKKRKVMAKWSEQVKVSSASAVEGPGCDGFSWRKYGQKDILGSKFPRSYFRCSHRFTQGCLATKQVQKSDNDPTIYEVTYKGRHTCNKALHSTNTPQEHQNTFLQHPIPPKQEDKPLQQLHDPLCFMFSSDPIRVKSEDLEYANGGLFQPLRTPSPMFGSEVQDDLSPFRESECSPTFESNDMFGLWCDFETEFVSIPSSMTNISIGDLEECFSFDNLEMFC